jgi:hypothetical protein
MAKGGESMVGATGAPWYEFWRTGLWSLGEWTHLHVTWLVWIARGDLIIGVVFAGVLVVVLSSEGGFSWILIPVAAFGVAVWAWIPFVSQTLAVFALLLPALLVWVAASEGWKRVEGWRNRGRAPSSHETRA